MSISIGDTAPDFTLPKDGGGTLALSDFLGKKVLLFFYPHDRTPGCTIEACAFRDAKEEFDDRKISIIGISRLRREP